jgi:hypothetical protein
MFAGTWGGYRGTKFDNAERTMLYEMIYAILKENPIQRLQDIVSLIEEWSDGRYVVSRAYLSRLFCQWGLSYKSVSYKNVGNN